MRRNILLWLIIGNLLLWISSLKASTATHLQVDYVASADSFSCKIPFYMRLSARDSNNNIDDTYGNSHSVTISVISGPGTFNGPFSSFFMNGIAEFTDVSFNTSGNYVIKFSSGSLAADTISIKMINYFSFTNSSSAIHFFDKQSQDTIATGDFLFRYVIATNNSNAIDTTCNASVSLNLIGAGSLMGVTNKNLNKGVAIFSSLSLTASGSNQIVCSSGSLTKDTSTVFVDTSTTSSDTLPIPTISCDTTTVGSRKNLGLYGGTCMDLTFSPNSRLFAGVRAPASLFYSDDTAKTWKAAFPVDSLEFNCGYSGWGGSALKIMANQRGWVAAYTEQFLGTLKSTAISFSNGDSGTWKTAIDETMMIQLGYSSQKPSSITLTNHYLYTAFTNTIVIQDSSGIKNIIDVSQYLGSFPSTNSIVSIAAANSVNGYPLYIIIDTTGNSGNNANGKLYRFNGSAFSIVPLPSGIKGISKVFTSPSEITGDTIFISTTIINANYADTAKTYRSYNGGNNWNDISWTLDPNVNLLSDVDYSSSWPGSGIALILSGDAISHDLGDTWEAIPNNQNMSACILPADKNLVFRSKYKGVEISNTGPTGIYAIADNYGLEAIEVNKIARTNSKSVFYIATLSGLAYTTAYLDSFISPFDKWSYPYGVFPVSSVNDSGGVFAVAIDPYDSLHVIAGGADNFNVTFTGPNGFQNISAIGLTANTYIKDILFVSSDIVLAVSGRNANATNDWGGIFRSTDGGLTWSIVIPSGFNSGNVLAMGISSKDTVLYAGSGFYMGGNEKGGVLWKSLDLGLSWANIHAGPSSIQNNAIDSMPIFDIAVDPRGTDTLYIASGQSTDQAFVVSYDGGITYHYTNLLGEAEFSSVSVDLSNPDSNVYVGNRREIFQYNPSLDTSTLIFTGLPGEVMHELAHGSILVGSTTGFYGVDGDETSIITSIQQKTENDKSIFALYPNPFSNEFYIDVNLSSQSNLKIDLIDFMGKEIIVIANNEHVTGLKHYVITTSNLASGTYFVKIKTNNESITKKVVVIK